MVRRFAILAAAFVALCAFSPVETPMFAEDVAAGRLPPVARRLPAQPMVVPMDEPWQKPGAHGGDLTMLMARAKDTRIIYVYSYARLVGYAPDLKLVSDILESFEDEGERVFTFRLRKGHRWSDGHPFTTEDFRYWWEDMALNPRRFPVGPPAMMLVDGRPPKVEILDETTIRYTWDKPNPFFLHRLADAKPPAEIYAPAHYLKRFHPRYTDAATLAARVAAAKQKSWQQLHNRLDDATELNNPDLPTLQPWVPVTQAPAERFVFVRNPYYHRVDAAGRQLPYIDRLVMPIADSKIIPAKTGAGEADLQARYLRFDNYTFLKQSAKHNNFDVRLWPTGIGAQIALFPNLTAKDPVWRAVLRDVRVRRALSLAIDRDEINQVIFYGLGLPSNNTVLPDSPLWKADYRTAWANFDLRRANRLLDQAGLAKRDVNGTRLLPDGRPMEIIVESAGESTEETDALELIADGWRRVGVRLFVRSSQLDVFRSRIFSGDTIMSVGRGVDNAIPTPGMSPTEFVPLNQDKYQWPRWGQYAETGGKDGEAPDLEPVREMMEAFERWRRAETEGTQIDAWRRILEINADQVFTLGVVARIPQPVVVRSTLRNLPAVGLFNYNPGAHFGIHRPDTFWFDRSK